MKNNQKPSLPRPTNQPINQPANKQKSTVRFDWNMKIRVKFILGVNS